MDCPYCGRVLAERDDVIARALDDSVPQVDGSHLVVAELVTGDLQPLGCGSCGEVLYMRREQIEDGE